MVLSWQVHGEFKRQLHVPRRYQGRGARRIASSIEAHCIAPAGRLQLAPAVIAAFTVNGGLLRAGFI
jgi:hypothetical protein